MTFGVGDRVRWVTVGDDGLPLSRYGYVGGEATSSGSVLVLLDDEVAGAVVELAQLAPVSFTSTELRLQGTDLLDDPALRRGLVSLWTAEAESAGLAIDQVEPYGDGQPDGPHRWLLADIVTCGARYLLSAGSSHVDPDVVNVRVDERR